MKRNPHSVSYLTTFAAYDYVRALSGAREGWLTVFKVPVPALGAQDEESADGDVCGDSSGAKPPYHRVAEQINLTVVPDPEVLMHIWLIEDSTVE